LPRAQGTTQNTKLVAPIARSPPVRDRDAGDPIRARRCANCAAALQHAARDCVVATPAFAFGPHATARSTPQRDAYRFVSWPTTAVI
jgi:hypothetical protein